MPRGARSFAHQAGSLPYDSNAAKARGWALTTRSAASSIVLAASKTSTTCSSNCVRNPLNLICQSEEEP